MLPDKITKNFKEISKFFVENFDNSANAIFTVLDMLKLSDKSLCFSTNYNAKYSFDYLKDIVASNELGFELIRVREKPLERVSELSKFVSRDGNDYKSLDWAIARVLIYIRREFNLLFDLSVSTYRDRRSIALLKAMKV